MRSFLKFNFTIRLYFFAGFQHIFHNRLRLSPILELYSHFLCHEIHHRIFYSADRIEKLPYLSLVRPKGTFYLFPGVEKTGLDDKQFCKELLERAHVLVSAGSPFGKTGANHFRIACTVGIDQLKQAFDRMEKLEF